MGIKLKMKSDIFYICYENLNDIIFYCFVDIYFAGILSDHKFKSTIRKYSSDKNKLEIICITSSTLFLQHRYNPIWSSG